MKPETFYPLLLKLALICFGAMGGIVAVWFPVEFAMFCAGPAK